MLALGVDAAHHANLKYVRPRGLESLAPSQDATSVSFASPTSAAKAGVFDWTKSTLDSPLSTVT